MAPHPWFRTCLELMYRTLEDTLRHGVLEQYKTHTNVPLLCRQVALTLPLDKARALVAAAGLGQEVLEDNEAAEAKLQQLRYRRAEQPNKHIKSTTSGATVRDVQLVACRLANCLCLSLDGVDGGGATGKGGSEGTSFGERGATKVVVDMLKAGGVDAVTLVFRMFEASDLELMVETLAFSLALTRGCAVTPPPPTDDSSDGSSFLVSISSRGELQTRGKEDAAELAPLLRPLYTPTCCRRVADIGAAFPLSRRVQRLCCLLVGELGATCGSPARRCFAECTEVIVAAAAGDLDGHAGSDSDRSSVIGVRSTAGDSSTRKTGSAADQPLSVSLPTIGVREAACQALATLAQEPGLSHRLAASGAGHAVTHAMEAAPRDHEVQLSCLATLAILAERNPSMWDGQVGGGTNDPTTVPAPAAIDPPCRRVVESMQNFVRDPSIHQAASRAILALLNGDTFGNAMRSVGTSGGATSLCRVLATSPNDGDVQLPAVLAIAKLLEGCGVVQRAVSKKKEVKEENNTNFESSTLSAQTGSGGLSVGVPPTVVSDLVAAAGCELLCKSAKTFPRDRNLRLGCLRAMAALCQAAGQAATERLIGAGVCEQVP